MLLLEDSGFFYIGTACGRFMFTKHPPQYFTKITLPLH